MDNLLILGAGQYGSVVKEIAQAMGCFGKINFLDDNFGKSQLDNNEMIIGTTDQLEQLKNEYSYAIPAIGNPLIRLSLIDKLEKMNYKIPVIISPRAYVSPSTKIEKGSVIEPLAGVHANAKIGKATYISMGAVVNHNAVVGDGCHVDSNAVVMSGAKIASGTKIKPDTVATSPMTGNEPEADSNLYEYNFDVGM